MKRFSQEPPVIKEVLLGASALGRDEYDIESTWKAANLYCKASRYDSGEGMYRLGMLYAFGNDVKKCQNYAENLFSLAAMQGHFEAKKVLEAIQSAP
ncbi:MAG: TPR repeat protein [Methylophilaceae bacterium]|jgi:TPR repeat protein